MPELSNQNPSWSDYLGDALRGNVPVNQLIPQHSYILDTLGLAESFEKYTQHLMLITLEEAQEIVDDLCNIQPVNLATTYAGNIRDGVTGAKNISKLITYVDAGKLVLRLKGLRINAIEYKYGGKIYIKITGYPSLRRILRGTRYKVNNPQILELGIGKKGINAGIMDGAKFCIWFSLAWRAVELIFKSEHDVAAFIGNITMDIAKIIVTIFATKILVMAGGALVAGMASVGFAVTLPIAAGIMLTIVIGIGITSVLDYLDKEYGLSQKLIAVVREGMKAQQDIMEWNMKHTDPFTLSLMNTYW